VTDQVRFTRLPQERRWAGSLLRSTCPQLRSRTTSRGCAASINGESAKTHAIAADMRSCEGRSCRGLTAPRRRRPAEPRAAKDAPIAVLGIAVQPPVRRHLVTRLHAGGGLYRFAPTRCCPLVRSGSGCATPGTRTPHPCAAAGLAPDYVDAAPPVGSPTPTSNCGDRRPRCRCGRRNGRRDRQPPGRGEGRPG
jgi:hypothetical protein